MVTYWPFTLPMILVLSLNGFIIGWAVGRKSGGTLHATMTSLALGLSPAIVGWTVGMTMYYLVLLNYSR